MRDFINKRIRLIGLLGALLITGVAGVVYAQQAGPGPWTQYGWGYFSNLFVYGQTTFSGPTAVGFIDAGTVRANTLSASGCVYVGPWNDSVCVTDSNMAFVSDGGVAAGGGAFVFAGDAGATFTGPVNMNVPVGDIAFQTTNTACYSESYGLNCSGLWVLGASGTALSVLTSMAVTSLIYAKGGIAFDPSISGYATLGETAGYNTPQNNMTLLTGDGGFTLSQATAPDIMTFSAPAAGTAEIETDGGTGPGTGAIIFAADAGAKFTGVVTASKGLTVGAGSAYTSMCDCSQGGCSMATTTTCTCTCTACTNASICYNSPYTSAATTNAVGVISVCASGTVTLTAKVGTTGTETFNVHCNN